MAGIALHSGLGGAGQKSGRRQAGNRTVSHAQIIIPFLINQNQHQMACSPLTAKDVGLFDSFEHSSNGAVKTVFKASNGKGFRFILIHLNNQHQMAANQQQIKQGKPPLLRNT